jgi:hypothetical protein
MITLLLSPRRKGIWRRFLWWLRSSGRFFDLPAMNENLAVGWFSNKAPEDPLRDGCGFIMGAALGENGELRARVGVHCLRAVRGIQNLRTHYVIALRERGAIYYAAASDGAHGLAAFPMMRPIAIDPFDSNQFLYAGVHQCALGQIGFRVDTRVHRVHIEHLPEFASAAGNALVSDRLIGRGRLEERPGKWRAIQGLVERTPSGATSCGGEAMAIADGSEPVGLIHALVQSEEETGAAGLIWRCEDERNFWLLKLSATGATLVRNRSGVAEAIATDSKHRLRPRTVHSVQIIDGFDQMGCYFDGELLFEEWTEDPSFHYSKTLGIWFDGTGRVVIREWEAHPRAVRIPASIELEASWRRLGHRVIIADQFKGSGELPGRKPAIGTGHWQRVVGRGFLDLGHGGARVRASVENPNPGRTFHTLPWPKADFADLEVTIRPPGTVRGQSERCRSGLVFWQDRDNYLSFTAYLDDAYQGASIALFPKRHGFEELYDAIWTMVADKVFWGRRFRMRITFDGNRFVILLNGEPIMERALTDLYPEDPPLRITQVGLATNWEWGEDTGSLFESFIARV